MENYKELITKGDVEVENVTTHNGDFYKVKVPLGTSICNVTTRNFRHASANAELIAESFNITNQCGFTPKEVLEQRDELAKLLHELNEGIDSFWNGNKSDLTIKKINSIQIKSFEAIQKTKP